MISSGILITGDYLDGKSLINGAIILPLFVYQYYKMQFCLLRFGVDKKFTKIYIYGDVQKNLSYSVTWM